jgi:hypothetical protein
MGVFFRCPTSESVRLESRVLMGLIAGARGVERVFYRRMVRLICAGWLPQGEVFELERCHSSYSRASHEGLFRAAQSEKSGSLHMLADDFRVPTISGLRVSPVHDR